MRVAVPADGRQSGPEVPRLGSTRYYRIPWDIRVRLCLTRPLAGSSGPLPPAMDTTSARDIPTCGAVHAGRPYLVVMEPDGSGWGAARRHVLDLATGGRVNDEG